MSQQLSAEKGVQTGEQTFESLPGYAHLIDYLYCLLASTVIVGQPLPGGAMYMAVLVTRLAARLTRPDQWRTLPKATRVSGYILSALSALIALALLLIYPRAVNLPHLWVLFGLILGVKLRDELIGGQKRRTALLRALWAPGDTLLLDEPFTGMDPAAVQASIALLRERVEGRPVLLATHDRAAIDALGWPMLELQKLAQPGAACNSTNKGLQ